MKRYEPDFLAGLMVGIAVLAIGGVWWIIGKIWAWAVG